MFVNFVCLHSLTLIYFSSSLCRCHRSWFWYLPGLCTVPGKMRKVKKPRKCPFTPKYTDIKNIFGSEPCYVVFDTDVEVIESHRDLEIIVSSNLKWREIVSVRQEKAYNTFHQIRRNCFVKNAVRAKLDQKLCFVCIRLHFPMLNFEPWRNEMPRNIACWKLEKGFSQQ